MHPRPAERWGLWRATSRRSWAEALTREHEHLRELLATLRGELGTFAQECASALTALDALVGLAAVSGLIDTAKSSYQNAADVRDIGRRLPGLAHVHAHDERLGSFYAAFGAGGDLSQARVRQAGELLREEPGRSDRELLNAVLDAGGTRSLIEQEVGPTAVAALGALAPLVRWVPKLRREEGIRDELIVSARKDLTTVLQSTVTAAGQAVTADTVALADSLRDTVEHVGKAARPIAEGRLEAALAEARQKLEADLAALHDVRGRAEHTSHAWRADRRADHSALTEEVRAELEKVEELRRALGLILPHLQAVARALATIEKLRSVEGRLDPPSAVGLEAARMSLLLSAAEAWEASLPTSRHLAAARPALPKRRWLVGAAVVLVAAAIAIALSLTGGSTKLVIPNTILNVTPTTGVPPAPEISPLRSISDPEQRATFYGIAVHSTRQGRPSYVWQLTPPKDNLACNKFGSVLGSPNRAVWHHADTDGCTHVGPQHTGTITVTITTRFWECTASFSGTLTSNGGTPQPCVRKNVAAVSTITTVTGIPPTPQISPLRSTFDPAQRATYYGITVHSTRQGSPIYTWHLDPPRDDPSCNKFAPVVDSPNRAVWHHADTDGCTQVGPQNKGTVTVTVTTLYWKCTASFVGTLTRSGSPPTACRRL